MRNETQRGWENKRRGHRKNIYVGWGTMEIERQGKEEVVIASLSREVSTITITYNYVNLVYIMTIHIKRNCIHSLCP